jgi:hypothetical protein
MDERRRGRGHGLTVSRRERRPSCAANKDPRNEEGAGNAGRWPQPMARLQKKSRRQLPQVQPNIRHSLRDGFTPYTCSPWCAGLFGHHHLRDARSINANLASASGCQDHTTSTSAKASHQHASEPVTAHRSTRQSRSTSLVVTTSSQPPHPTPRVVTIAIRPSYRGGMHG